MRSFLDGQFNYQDGIEESNEPGTYVYTNQMYDTGYQIGDGSMCHRGNNYVDLESNQNLIYQGYGNEDEKVAEEGFEVKSIYDECISFLNGNYRAQRVNEIRRSKINVNRNELELAEDQETYAARMDNTKYYYNCNNGSDNSLFIRKQGSLKNAPYAESIFSCAHNEKECMLLIEEAREGGIVRIRRRLSENEKALIRPGSVFIYKEQESNIKRWTDKREWTPSRVHGAFLVYKELNGILYKKTFSKAVLSEKYHVVMYSSIEWERTRDCCRVFCKSKNKLCERMNQKIHRILDTEPCSTMHSLCGSSQFHNSNQGSIQSAGFGRYSDSHTRRDSKYFQMLPANNGRIRSENEISGSLDFGCSPIRFSEANEHGTDRGSSIKRGSLNSDYQKYDEKNLFECPSCVKK